jgi:tetratricopeptide (TPR) repeat protein
MSKYNIDLDYEIRDIDITGEELKEIKAEANKIITEYKESKENLAVAYLKKVQCLRKLGAGYRVGFIFYEDMGMIHLYDEMGIFIDDKDIKLLLNMALNLSPDMPEVLMQLGLLKDSWSSIETDKDEAKNLFSMAIQLKPDYAAAFNSRAMLFHEKPFDLENKNNFEKDKINFRNAVADLTEAIRIRPFDALYHLNRATFHSKLGEHKEAIEDFSNAINYASDILKEQLKTNVLIYNLRGKGYTELKDFDKAIEDFSETLRLEPDYNNDALLLRGKAYYLACEKDKAKADFEEYLNRKHKDADTAARDKISKLIGVMPEDVL